MADQFPLPIIFSWLGMAMFAGVHISHGSNFMGSSRKYFQALTASVIAWALCGLLLLALYFFKVKWYWPALLLFPGLTIGFLLSNVLERSIGTLRSSLLSFIGWPACAVWFYYAMKAIPRHLI